ncbi:MAG: putative glycoside hydrolase [Armatimonadetes bacterium]|nr:putative glycoside hydrolase [Armatimonadota bacterium]
MWCIRTVAAKTFGVLVSIAAVVAASMASASGQGYPRIANLWGFGPTTDAAQCEKLARYDLLVMAGTAGADKWRKFRAELEKHNPDIILLGTAPLMNVGPPEATPWMRDEWFLRRPSGEKINWWAGQVYVPNIFIDECLDALVAQTEQAYGPLLADGTLDGVFYDSVVGWVTWLGEVDTDRDGQADVADEVNPRWRARQNLFFDRLRERWPRILILANDVDAGHRPHVNGRLFEGAPLLDRLVDGALHPQAAIRTLNEWMTKSHQPGITLAIMTHPLGWQGWRVGRGAQVTTRAEVERVRRDFSRMRLGLLTALMTDAYYSYDFGTVWYGLPWWYAEYDAPLGRPLGPAKEVFDVPPVVVLDWKAGQPVEAFVLDGESRATPRGIEGSQTDPEAIWTRLFATDAEVVRLEPGKAYRIVAECEVLQKPTRTFQFDVRTPTGGWEKHDKGVLHNAGETGSTWIIETTVTPDDFPDYCLEWHVSGAGGLRLRALRILSVSESYWLREFEGGIAVLNASPREITVKLGQPMRRLKDDEAPAQIMEIDDSSPDFSAEGAWEGVAGDGGYYGLGYRLAAKPGATATWSFKAPTSDTYTFFACVPSGRSLTDAAAYSLSPGGIAANISQRKGDGGWVKLFQCRLRAGERYTVSLRSGGTGPTAADAIRIESAARYNDGATVTSLTLAPRDGTLLLR